MKTLYLDSYYQYPTFQKCLKKDLPVQIKEIIKEMIGTGGQLRISYQNLKLLGNIRTGSLDIDEARYITALHSDLEVAIQEKKLINIAKKLGFEVVLRRSNDTLILDYLEEYPVNDLDLEAQEIIQGDIYVINTHGKAQSIDGPYYQALYNTLNLQRILIDACSSASGSFPINNSGNKSAIEVVADEGIKARKDEKLEIVGYKQRFDTTKSGVSARAAFANAEKIAKESDLTLITLAERKKHLMQIKERQQIKAKERILQNFEKATVNRSAKEALKLALIEVSSKFLSKILYIKMYLQKELPASLQEKAIKLIVDMTEDNEHTLKLINDLNKNNYKKTLKKLKNKKNEYIHALSEEKIIELAKMTKEICNIHYLTISDNNYLTSIDLLASLLDKSEEQGLEHLEGQRLDANNYTPGFFQPQISTKGLTTPQLRIGYQFS